MTAGSSEVAAISASTSRAKRGHHRREAIGIRLRQLIDRRAQIVEREFDVARDRRVHAVVPGRDRVRQDADAEPSCGADSRSMSLAAARN